MSQPESRTMAEYDALLEMERSAGYRYYVTQLNVELERESRRLEKPAGQPETDRLRGFLQALRFVLDLPESLRTQIYQEVNQSV